MNLLTSKEMAKLLRRSEKSFNKNVREYGLPFIPGRPRLFDPAKILPLMEMQAPVIEKQDLPQMKKRSAPPAGWTRQDEKFAQELGIKL
jgi:hypothetical protein